MPYHSLNSHIIKQIKEGKKEKTITKRLNYELELKYIKLKRLLGANMLTNELPRE